MLTLTTFEKHMHRALIARARMAQGDRGKALITYGEVGQLLRPVWRVGDPDLNYPFSGLYEAIGHVSSYEVEHGRPMVSALIVTKETGEPGPGFTKLAVHLGFEFADAREFWSDEVDEVLFVWGESAGIEVLDRAVEVIDGRLNSVRRALRARAAQEGPYLVRAIANRLSTKIRPATISLENVGGRGAVDALYFAWLPAGMWRTDIFHLSAGAAKQLPLVEASLTYSNNRGVMGDQIDGAAEVLICGDGTGRWLRVRPLISQKPDYWNEGSAEPDWIDLYKAIRQGFER